MTKRPANRTKAWDKRSMLRGSEFIGSRERLVIGSRNYRKIIVFPTITISGLRDRDIYNQKLELSKHQNPPTIPTYLSLHHLFQKYSQVFCYVRRFYVPGLIAVLSIISFGEGGNRL